MNNDYFLIFIKRTLNYGNFNSDLKDVIFPAFSLCLMATPLHILNLKDDYKKSLGFSSGIMNTKLKGVGGGHNAFNPLRLPGHCSPYLSNSKSA